jgi:hypothetical protein
MCEASIRRHNDNVSPTNLIYCDYETAPTPHKHSPLVYGHKLVQHYDSPEAPLVRYYFTTDGGVYAFCGVGGHFIVKSPSSMCVTDEVEMRNEIEWEYDAIMRPIKRDMMKMGLILTAKQRKARKSPKKRRYRKRSP